LGLQLSTLAILVATATATATAYAQAPPNPRQAEGEEAFRQGSELLKAGKYIDACEQFHKSQLLDPQLGTLFKIAQCSDKIGKLATAAAAYRELVARDMNPARKTASQKALQDLAGRIPKIVAKIDQPPPGIIITLDSKSGSRTLEPNQPVEADFGAYHLVARAKGYTEMISQFRIGEEGSTKTVQVTLLRGANNSDILNPPADPPAVVSHSKLKPIGVGLMAGGGAALATGLVFGVLARSTYGDAKDICGGTMCMSQDDVSRANDKADQARGQALISTVFVASGALIAGAGLALWVTAPSDGVAVSVSGRF
jgi:hypothetical protein